MNKGNIIAIVGLGITLFVAVAGWFMTAGRLTKQVELMYTEQQDIKRVLDKVKDTVLILDDRRRRGESTDAD